MRFGSRSVDLRPSIDPVDPVHKARLEPARTPLPLDWPPPSSEPSATSSFGAENARATVKEVVWVYGASGAGKETFIRDVLSGRRAAVAKQLGWLGRRVASCIPSLDYVGQSDDDQIIHLRSEIPDSVGLLLESSDVVLVKGQRVDFEAQRLDEVRERFPSCRHRIIVLSVSPEELAARLPRKRWWDDRHDPCRSAADDLRLLARTLGTVRPRFETLVVDLRPERVGPA